MEDKVFIVNQSVPTDRIELYKKLLRIFAEVGIDMIKDCTAVKTLGNKTVIDCYIMFNSAVSAFHQAQYKKANLLFDYVEGQLDLLYKNVVLEDVKPIVESNDILEAEFGDLTLNPNIIVHRCIPENPEVGKTYVFCGWVNRKSSIGVSTYDFTEKTWIGQYDVGYNDCHQRIDNALITVTITLESILNGFDIEKAYICAYKFNKNNKIRQAHSVNIENYFNKVYDTKFTSNTSSKNFIIRDNKVLCINKVEDKLKCYILFKKRKTKIKGIPVKRWQKICTSTNNICVYNETQYKIKQAVMFTPYCATKYRLKLYPVYRNQFTSVRMYNVNTIKILRLKYVKNDFKYNNFPTCEKHKSCIYK